MDRSPIAVDRDALRREMLAVNVFPVVDGSGHGGDGFRSGWINGLSNIRLFLHRPGKASPEIDWLLAYPVLRQEIGELMSYTGHYQLRQVMVNSLAPGGELTVHRDGPPDDWRYHLPIDTNPDAKWWDEINGTVHMDFGYWHGPVSYCGVLHSAVNHGPKNRVHVVCDFGKV